MQSFITISKLFGISIKLSVAEQLFELYITNPGESSWIGGWWQHLSVLLVAVITTVRELNLKFVFSMFEGNNC